MLDTNDDLGAALFKTWTEKQRCDEIQKLVAGYRNGVPVGILCKMSETIAGDRKKAKKYIKLFMTDAERASAIESASASLQPLVAAVMK